MQFDEFPKIPRLNREVIATEKIDGTNASICIVPSVGEIEQDCLGRYVRNGVHLDLFAGSRTRWITPKADNFGFASWALANAEDLLELGVGHHYGEWWGKGIQRGYDLESRRFSLFNVSRWVDRRPNCCSVVPVLGRKNDIRRVCDEAIAELKATGSKAAPGYMKPEGIVLFHTQGNLLFKVTLEKDSEPKSLGQTYAAGVTRIGGAV